MSPGVWAGPAAVAAAVLLLAGVAKVVRPGDTRRALDAAGVPGGAALVRTGALAEAVLGLWALGWGHPLAMASVAVSYAGFTLFLVWAMARSLPISSCGCFGEPDVPPTAVHVGVDLAAGIAAAGAAISKAPSVVTVLGGQPWAGVPYALLVALATSLAVLTLTRLPRLHALGNAIGTRS